MKTHFVLSALTKEDKNILIFINLKLDKLLLDKIEEWQREN